MGQAEIIAEGIYIVGGPNISRSEDATVFIVDGGDEMVMIDAGAGRSARILENNILDAGLDPKKISLLILTHCHIDHIGAADYFRREFGCRIAIHDGDAAALETGDAILTAANWYETNFPPLGVDVKLTGGEGKLKCGSGVIHWLHTPGHTPGSICLYVDRGGKRILFGQDIHGPFLPSFRSDIGQWRHSMEKLLQLNADILCEGHFGIFQPRAAVEKYIRRYLRQNS
ncbi:MAG: MBL fold metallo-hydrolase [Syntrophobacterales bacterium]|nr:MBL fold metallo-hydrolase [Syntrophobacterales bacterium]